MDVLDDNTDEFECLYKYFKWKSIPLNVLSDSLNSKSRLYKLRKYRLKFSNWMNSYNFFEWYKCDIPINSNYMMYKEKHSSHLVTWYVEPVESFLFLESYHTENGF